MFDPPWPERAFFFGFGLAVIAILEIVLSSPDTKSLFHDLIDWMDDHEGAVVGSFTLVLAVATIWLAYSTWGLWNETADSSKRQEVSTRVLQRAYLGVD